MWIEGWKRMEKGDKDLGEVLSFAGTVRITH